MTKSYYKVKKFITYSKGYGTKTWISNSKNTISSFKRNLKQNKLIYPKETQNYIDNITKIRFGGYETKYVIVDKKGRLR